MLSTSTHYLKTLSPFFFLFAMLILPLAVYADGGTRGSNGLEPTVTLSDWRVGQWTTLRVTNVASQATDVFLLVGFYPNGQDFSQYFGTSARLKVRPSSNPSEFTVIRVPPEGISFIVIEPLVNTPVYLQAVAIDPGAVGGAAISDGVAFRGLRPVQGPINKAIGPTLPLVGYYEAGLVQDSLTGKTYLIGGRNASYTGYDSIVEIDSSQPFGQEINVLPDRLPVPNGGFAVVWDPIQHAAYIFGGAAFAAVDKIVRFEPGRPSGQRVETLLDRLPGNGRAFAGVARDPRTGLIYLFDGTAGSSVPTILAFNPSAPSGNRLQTLPVTIPDSFAPTYADWYDRGNKAYFFDTFTPYYLSPGSPRVFAFDPSIPQVTQQPEQLMQRGSVTLDYDPNEGAYIMQGGYNQSTLEWFYYNDVFGLYPDRPAGSRLILLNKIDYPRSLVASLFDPLSGKILVAGGWGFNRELSAKGLNDLAGFSPHSNMSTPLSLLKPAPYPFAFYDAAQEKIYVFGTYDQRIERSIQVLSITGVSLWDKAEILEEQLPSPLTFMTGVWDPVSREAYIFGGSNGTTSMNTIIRFRPDSTTNRIELLTDRLPRPLIYSASVWDHVRRVAYIFGGNSNSGDRNEIYQFDPRGPAGSRVQTLPERLPGLTSSTGAVYVPINDNVYLFGGIVQGLISPQILRFSPAGTPGSRLTVLPQQMPQGLLAAQAVYDPNDQVVYLFAPMNTTWTSMGKILQFDPQTSQTNIVAQMDARRYPTAVYVSSLDMHMVIGGQAPSFGTSSDMWAFKRD